MRIPLPGYREFRAHLNSEGVSVQYWPIRKLSHYTLTLWFRPRVRLRRYGRWA